MGKTTSRQTVKIKQPTIVRRGTLGPKGPSKQAILRKPGAGGLKIINMPHPDLKK